MSTSDNTTNKPWWKNWKIWVAIIVALTVIGTVQKIIDPEGSKRATETTIPDIKTDKPAPEYAQKNANLAEDIVQANLQNGQWETFEQGCDKGMSYLCQVVEIKASAEKDEIEVHFTSGEYPSGELLNFVATNSCINDVRPDKLVAIQDGKVEARLKASSIPICE